jgi:hypothetical protein
MEQNPYQPPLIDETQTSAEALQSERGPRPVGIWLLSGLHVFVGVVFLAAAIAFQIAAALGVEDATGPIEADWLLTGLFCALATYAILSGVGLWRGDRWGWWLSAFYWVGMLVNWIGEGSVTVWKMWQPDWVFLVSLTAVVLLRFLIHFFLVVYHFKRSVREFFGLERVGMVKTIAMLSAIWMGLAVLIAVGIFAYFVATRGLPF